MERPLSAAKRNAEGEKARVAQPGKYGRGGEGYACPCPRGSACARHAGGPNRPGTRPMRECGLRSHPGRVRARPRAGDGIDGAGRCDGRPNLCRGAWGGRTSSRATKDEVPTGGRGPETPQHPGPAESGGTSRAALLQFPPSTPANCAQPSTRNRNRAHGGSCFSRAPWRATGAAEFR